MQPSTAWHLSRWHSCWVKNASHHHISIYIYIFFRNRSHILIIFLIGKQTNNQNNDLQKSSSQWTQWINKGIHKKAMQVLTSLQSAWHNHGQKTHCMVRSSTMASWASRQKVLDSSSLGFNLVQQFLHLIPPFANSPTLRLMKYSYKDKEKNRQFNWETDVMADFVFLLQAQRREQGPALSSLQISNRMDELLELGLTKWLGEKVA